MIKKFKEYFQKTKEVSIDYKCEKYGIRNYSINPDFSIDVDGDVYLNHGGINGDRKIKYCPLKFNEIKGNFNISDNSLITLEGCPKYVNGDFIIRSNKLTSLKGCPEYVGGEYFQFNDNNIYTLEGAPKIIGKITAFDNPIEEIFTLFYTHRALHLYDIDEKILEAWNLYKPVYYKNKKWYIYDYRLRELYIDVTGNKYVGPFPIFKNYILDET